MVSPLELESIDEDELLQYLVSAPVQAARQYTSLETAHASTCACDQDSPGTGAQPPVSHVFQLDGLLMRLGR